MKNHSPTPTPTHAAANPRFVPSARTFSQFAEKSGFEPATSLVCSEFSGLAIAATYGQKTALRLEIQVHSGFSQHTLCAWVNTVPHEETTNGGQYAVNNVQRDARVFGSCNLLKTGSNVGSLAIESNGQHTSIFNSYPEQNPSPAFQIFPNGILSKTTPHGRGTIAVTSVGDFADQNGFLSDKKTFGTRLIPGITFRGNLDLIRFDIICQFLFEHVDFPMIVSLSATVISTNTARKRFVRL